MKDKPQTDPTYPIPASWQSAQRLYQGSRFAVYSQEVTIKSGEVVKREAIVHPGAVVILPLMDDKSILMIRNKRFIVGETLWELPAGTLEPSEAPMETAKREIIEETGYRADVLTHLMHFYSSPGFCTEMLYSFVAKGLHFVGQDLDDSEEITAEALAWSQIESMLRNQTIRDAKTLACLFYYRLFLKSSVDLR